METVLTYYTAVAYTTQGCRYHTAFEADLPYCFTTRLREEPLERVWPRAPRYQRERCLLASERVRNQLTPSLAAVNPGLQTLKDCRYSTSGARSLATFAVIHGPAAGHGELAALRLARFF